MERAAPVLNQVFVARQGVFDAARKVVGYELLLQAPTGMSGGESLDRLSARALSDAIVAVGLDALAGGSRAFVTVSRRLLLDGLPDVLPPTRVVLQLGADIEGDADVLAACRAMRDAGYALAIDDFTLTPWTEDLVPFASFVKVDVGSLDPAARARILAAEAAGGAALLAKNVETTTMFDDLAAAGCRFFQGGFLGHPVVRQGKVAHGPQITYLRLLQALNNPNRSLDDLDELVKHDAPLCFKLLRTVNSAGFGLRSTVTSIRDALLLLGRDTVRRWASLWGLASLSQQAHSELVATATIRARSCEVLAGTLRDGDDLAPQAFLVGLCSLLDAILERSMTDVLEGFPIAGEAKAALLGEDNRLRTLLDCAIAYERGQWQRAVDCATRLRLDPARLPGAYEDALKWSREFEKQRA